MLRRFEEASFLLNAERIRRICWLPFAMLVKAKKQKNKKPAIAKGMAILIDFESTIYTANPANIQKIAVRVPDANILLMTIIPIIMKSHLYFFNFEVIPIIRKATDAAAALQP
jgi:hypothetical protein